MGSVIREPFEYEYEYRCTEYEYDWPAERWRSAGGNGASDLDIMEKSERHFRSVASLCSVVFSVPPIECKFSDCVGFPVFYLLDFSAVKLVEISLCKWS